ncbi:MAG TPA: nitroreductase family protein, partial [bacterium]|nr:nitroreductase family protein [bacterium]
LSAVFERTISRYGKRGNRYVPMDVGHAGENIYLQCVALNLGTVAVGAFRDEEVHQALGLPETEHPMYIMPIGHPAYR